MTIYVKDHFEAEREEKARWERLREENRGKPVEYTVRVEYLYTERPDDEYVQRDGPGTHTLGAAVEIEHAGQAYEGECLLIHPIGEPQRLDWWDWEQFDSIKPDWMLEVGPDVEALFARLDKDEVLARFKAAYLREYDGEETA